VEIISSSPKWGKRCQIKIGVNHNNDRKELQLLEMGNTMMLRREENRSISDHQDQSHAATVSRATCVGSETIRSWMKRIQMMIGGLLPRCELNLSADEGQKELTKRLSE
jgi:hypothetical protein